MIINSIKSLFTYTNRESLDLINSPNIDNKNFYKDYYNFINSTLIIYGNQRIDGTIPVFWTRIKDNTTLQREADPNSTLKQLKYNESYYIEVINKSKLPVKVPQPLDSNEFLHLNNIGNNSPCFDNLCNTSISIPSGNHRNINLNSKTGYSTNIHIPISGLLPNKNYTFDINPIYSNWPNKLTKISGTILRNSPLDNYGTVQSSIDTKFLYLYIDGSNNFDNSLPYDLIDISQNNHSKNIFSTFLLKIYDNNNNIKYIDTINILCDTCVPTPTFIPSPTQTPTLTATPTKSLTPTITLTPSVTPTIGSSPTPTPTITVTNSPTLTPTPSTTLDEPSRRCPYINIRNKNITLDDKNYTKIISDFYYLNPNKEQAYEFTTSEANWSSVIIPQKAPITNYSIYYENGLKYASGTIESILYINNNINSYNNLNFSIPFYSSEDFFNKNKFINLNLRIGTYTNNLGFNIALRENDRCSLSSDTINIICNDCVASGDAKDCIERVSIIINDSNLEYPEINQGSKPGAEILVDKECCKKNNTIYADVSGLCSNNVYLYEWNSFPDIRINPSSGLLAINDNSIARINTVYNLEHNQISSLKLKITDLNTNKYIEDNVLLRCNNGCYSLPLTPIISPTPTKTPSRQPLTFDDYILIFIDEASPEYVDFSNNTPGPSWYNDLMIFNELNNNQYIDINKILVFHVRGSSGFRQSIFPFVENNIYELPISLNAIIDTPRNNPSRLVDNEALTGTWIYNKVNNTFGSISSNSRINLFIDISGSMTLDSVISGIQEYETILTSNSISSTRVLCGTQRWLRWIVNVYNGNTICS